MKPLKYDHAKVITQAEYIFLGAMLMGFLTNFIWRIRTGIPKIVHIPVGIFVMLIGIVVLFLSMEEYRKARTYSSPYKSASTLIINGPYKYLKHPMYLGRFLQVFGIGIIFGNIWILILLMMSLIVVWYGIVIPEEQYLARRFGKQYAKYTASIKHRF